MAGSPGQRRRLPNIRCCCPAAARQPWSPPTVTALKMPGGGRSLMPPDPQHPMRPPSHNAQEKAFAAVHGLEVAVRHAVRAASPRLVGRILSLGHPTSAGAVGLRFASLEVPTSHDAAPAPDFPVGPEPRRYGSTRALMVSNGPSGGVAWPRKSPSNPGCCPSRPRSGRCGFRRHGSRRADGGVLSLRRGQRVREGGREAPALRGVVVPHPRRRTGTPRSPI